MLFLFFGTVLTIWVIAFRLTFFDLFFRVVIVVVVVVVVVVFVVVVVLFYLLLFCKNNYRILGLIAVVFVYVQHFVPGTWGLRGSDWNLQNAPPPLVAR